MEPYNWFPGKQNDFSADARLPASIVGQFFVAATGVPTLPIPALAQQWVEPPYATIGLGTGTMASYARPFQHMTYYEIDEQIRNFSLPTKALYEQNEKAYFTYLLGAMRRGANLELLMGDARLSMERGEMIGHGKA